MGDILSRLREATRAAHEQLEFRLDIIGQAAMPATRRQLVERFWGLHGGMDRALSPMLSGLAGLDYAGRCRMPFLASDLAALGTRDPDALPVCPVAAPRTTGEALGILYVLEGSTLGGHVLRREMLGRGLSMKGLSFLDPYGKKVGERWRVFLDILRREAEGDPERGAEVVLGGIAGFEQAQRWLCSAELADAA